MGLFACLRGGGREADGVPDAGDVRTPTLPCRRTPPAGRRRANRGTAGGPGRPDRPDRPGSREQGDPGADALFPVKVPEGCVPGQSIRVEAPSGRLMDVVVPPRCWPGQELLVRPSGAPRDPDPRRERLNEFVEMIRLTLSATRSSTRSLRQRLNEELEMQKALWASAARPKVLGADADRLLHIQALTLLAAEMGEVQQLVAALQEASQVCDVSPSLEQAARELCSSEEAALTWRCLLDSLVAGDVEGSQVWLEQAKAFGLSVPDDLVSILEDLAGASAEAGGPVTVTARRVGGGVPARPGGGAPAGSGGPGRGAGAGACAEQPDTEVPRAGSAEGLGDRSAKELLEECRRRCLDTAGCTTREDLLGLLRSGPQGAGPRAMPERAAAPAEARPPVYARPADWHLHASSTVWERRAPPSHCATRRAKALWLLGLRMSFDGAAPGAAAELRAAYRKAAMETHPDKMQNHGRQDEATEEFQRVKEAFDLVSSTLR